MKKIKSRWFAMLLILSLVFTMGMPMGMTVFGEDLVPVSAEVIPVSADLTPALPVAASELTEVKSLGSEEEMGAAMVAAPDNDDYLELSLDTINGEGLAANTGVEPGLTLVPSATYTISGTVSNSYDSLLLDYVHINQVNAVCGSTSVSISDLVSDNHYHGVPFFGHWDRSHATENFTITFVAQDGASTASVEVTGQREFWKTKQSAVASFAYNGVVPTQAYPVTFGVTGTHGTLTAAVGPDAIVTGAQVLANKTVDFTAAPAVGYRVKEWTVNGAVQAGKPLVLNQPISAATVVTVEFEKIANATITITGDDKYDLYVNGVEVNPYGANQEVWNVKDDYRVQLEGNYIIAVKVYDEAANRNITGLNVEVNFDNEDVQDITGASMWSWKKGETGDDWAKAAVVTDWEPAVAVDLNKITQENSWKDVTGTWIWSSQEDVADNATPVFFRCTGTAPVPQKYTVNVESDGNGIAYIGSKSTPLVVSQEVVAGSELVLHAEPNAHYSFSHWTMGEEKRFYGADLSVTEIQSAATYKAHFVKNFEGALTLVPKDDAVDVPKKQVLTMTFNGLVNPFTFYEMGSLGTERQDDFIIFNSADGTPFASFNIPVRPMSAMESGPDKESITLTPGLSSPGASGSINGKVVTLDPGKDFVAGASYYVFAPRLEIKDPEMKMSAMNFFRPPYSDGFPGFGEKTDWNFTIVSDPIPGGPSTPGAPQTITTTERDRADGPVATVDIEPQTVPQGLPVVAPAPAQIVEEAIPLGVPVLPKTGEIPASLFYGIGGILAAAGAFMKRK